MESSSPGGFPIGFFKENWDLLGEYITHTVLNILFSQVPLSDLNLTDLVLILKVKNPLTPADFKPIGLCNSIYKIVSKTISDRLSKILPTIIDENQGVFFKNKGVGSTALAGLELIHQVVYASNSRNHRANIAIKLDLSKAFDHVEWDFLINIMQKLEFPAHFIHLIHHCLCSTQISIRFNSQKTSYFKPTQGLR